MNGTTSVIHGADLRVTCLCGCRGVRHYTKMDIEFRAMMTPDGVHAEFSHFVVTLSKDLHPHLDATCARVQVRGETSEFVFALPCLTYLPGGVWQSHPDRDGNHYAIKGKSVSA